MRLAHPILFVALFVSTTACAAEAPIALRYWGGDTVSIESWWHGPLVIGEQEPAEHPAAHAILTAKGVRIPADLLTHPLEDEAWPLKFESWYQRLPNAEKLKPVLPGDAHENQAYSYLVQADPDWSRPNTPDRLGPLLVTLDSVRLLYWKTFPDTELTDVGRRELANLDILILPIDDSKGTAKRVATELRPRVVLPLSDSPERLEAALQAVPDGVDVQRVEHNTIAVSPTEDRSGTRVVTLQPQPWQPTGELAQLIEQMETACRASQEVFKPLSANQMNFRPANGTHTPRWNPEHMMGRQLLFFSQIYAALDPAHKPIDLNPAQMPPDYQAAHPDWTGAEEARQMQRAADYVRRFAYLLEGVPLDEPAPGSRWTLRGLLEQMARHFAEHTANVQKKFELPGWPAE